MPAANRIIESDTVFSKSILWQLQRQYFAEKGIVAWQSGSVPHYVTSNPVIAKAYAEMVFGFLRDRSRLAPGHKDKVYLLELGAGSGRLAFHFLKHITKLCNNASFDVPDFTYILSDFTDSNLSFWKQNAQLQSFSEMGWLDYARFDAESEQEIFLQVAGITIRRQSLSQPLLIIANYFFDTIPQDLFYIANQKLYEARATVLSPAETAGNSLDDVKVKYRKVKQTNSAYYAEEPRLNMLLEDYCLNIKGSWLLFPHIAIKCLERLNSLSTAGFVLLSADKGSHQMYAQDELSPPSLVKHGSFSLTVNFHAIKTYFDQLGALSLFTDQHYHSINVSCIMMLADPANYRETQHCYDTYIEDFGPDDFFRLKKHFEQHINSMELWQFESYIRLSGYDARLFKQCLPHLRTIVGDLSPEDKHNLKILVDRVWDKYFHIGESEDLAFELGCLCYQMNLYADALRFFLQSMLLYPGAAPLYYNVAACFYTLGQDEAALHYIEKTLEAEENHEGAIRLKNVM